MAPTPSIVLHRDSDKFSSVLSSALSEWFLMLLLFIDGLFSYLVTKFARACKLQTPCLICSRLDHILGNEKPDFYRDLICNAHKSEIMSLDYCYVHGADSQDMRQNCSFLFPTDRKSNPETYQPLARKLGLNLDDSVNAYPRLPITSDGDGQLSSYRLDDVADPLPNKDLEFQSPLTRHCSLCSKSFTSKSDALRLLQSKPDGVEVAEVGISSPSLPEQNSSQFHDALSLATDSYLAPPAISPSENNGFDCLSHTGYNELRVAPDSELEIPFSHGDDGTVLNATGDFKGEFMDRCLQPESVITRNSSSPTVSYDKAVDKLIHPALTMLDPLSIPEKLVLDAEFHDISRMASTVAIGHDLEEVNVHQVELKHNPPTSEITSQEVSLEKSNEKCIVTTSSGELSMALSLTESNLRKVGISTDSSPSWHVPMDLNDAYKLVIGSSSTSTSPTFEVLAGRGSSRVHEDLKSLIRQVSSSGRIESPWIDLIPSPRVSYPSDEYKLSDASSSAILQNITRRVSLERNLSGLESLDGSNVSEIEGENVTDRLKRLVELDRKSINLLYTELEEERSASAIAVNQAMAMITKLQQEKSDMQMEALQYQRVMEDQAEYDQEALQKSNELLAQKERELQDLRCELESYRIRVRDDSAKDKMLNSSDSSVCRAED